MLVINNTKNNYLNAWTNIFKHILGWSAQHTKEWAISKGYIKALSDSGDMLYHKEPQYWVVNSIIKALDLQHLDARQKNRLRSDLQASLVSPKNFVIDTLVDWNEVKNNINKTLETYHVSLPNARQPELISWGMNISTDYNIRQINAKYSPIKRSMAIMKSPCADPDVNQNGRNNLFRYSNSMLTGPVKSYTSNNHKNLSKRRSVTEGR
ncbi:MAG: hypothetical protein EOO20_26640 [Chryseobacterium sp.]|nr:MAG: hypothetical protein EOO20_26640 [Chryseobacterium sp.]